MAPFSVPLLPYTPLARKPDLPNPKRRPKNSHASAPSSTGASVATSQPEVAGKMPAAGSETVLRSHIAVLEKEVARLREEGDRRERGEDGSEAPPPLYREVVGATPPGLTSVLGAA